jgi:hypothetical protein
MTYPQPPTDRTPGAIGDGVYAEIDLPANALRYALRRLLERHAAAPVISVAPG